MVAASDRHKLVAGKVSVALYQPLRGSPRQVRILDMKVRIRVGNDAIFYYPHVVVSCAQDDREPYFRTQPCLTVEVLSDTTERAGRQEKLLAFTRTGSLETYVLLAQDLAEATLYRRSTDWSGEQVVSEGILSLDCVGLDLGMMSVYEDVDVSRRAQPARSKATLRSNQPRMWVIGTFCSVESCPTAVGSLLSDSTDEISRSPRKSQVVLAQSIGWR